MENVTFRLEPEELATVDRLAEQEKRTRSQMVRILITEAIAERQAPGLVPEPFAQKKPETK
jgi:predicted transcriptional regulator